ncbi:uncharacterized protein [Mobula birostris]|uniref:uncharacterized protein isoform X2 n=1 Tax=Mobula birostris TaxID=1983395 RepID=UPI003B28AE7C
MFLLKWRVNLSRQELFRLWSRKVWKDKVQLVQCYGRGDVHEKIVKELKICQCEGPGVPCVLFVYKVSHENQDLRDALQWVTRGETVRKEDICSVILLQKSGDFRVNKMMTDPGLFHEGTNVFQIFWTEMSVTWTSADDCHAVIQTVRQTLVDKTKSRGVFWPGSSKDQQGSETLSLCSAPTLMCSEQPDLLTSSTCTQEKSEKSSEKLQCNVQCYGRGDVHEKIVKKLNINQCEGPRIPCVLFVYKVSREIQDFQTDLQWVTDSSKMKAFLNKIKFPQITVEDQQILDAPVTEHEIQKAVLSMQSGSSEDRQGSETLSLCSAPTWMCSEQPDHLTPSTCTQEKSKRSSEKFQCNAGELHGLGRSDNETSIRDGCHCPGAGVRVKRITEVPEIAWHGIYAGVSAQQKMSLYCVRLQTATTLTDSGTVVYFWCDYILLLSYMCCMCLVLCVTVANAFCTLTLE